MNYWERNGEQEMTYQQEQDLEERLKREERIEELEICLETIKGILEDESKELKEKVSEIEYEIKSLES